MLTIPPRQRATLARRIAAGLPVWAAARGSNLPAEEVGELMWESEFRELIGAWAEILDMDPEARKVRLLKLAAMVIEQKLADGCDRTAFFVQREYRRKRDPAATLAKGFSQLAELERVRAERENALRRNEPRAAASTTPEPSPSPVEPSPVQAATAQAEAAAKLRGAADPVDAALWRKAGQLRHGMLGEQVLFHGVVRKAEHDRLMGPPGAVWLPEPDGIGEAAFPPEPPEPEPDRGAVKEESDEAFAARATAMFNATLAQAPPEIRELLAKFSQDELVALIGSVWPGDEPDEDGAAQPQAP